MVAMGTNNEVGDKIKRYFLYCESLVLAGPEIIRLAPIPQSGTLLPGIEEHLMPAFQRQQAQRLQRLLREQGGVNAVIRHGSDSCRSQTGLGAREVMQLGQAVGLPARSRTSAREVLRHMAPAVACAMSLLDTAVLFGGQRESIAPLVAEHGQPLFAGLLAAGLGPAETFPGPRFIG